MDIIVPAVAAASATAVLVLVLAVAALVAGEGFVYKRQHSSQAKPELPRK